MLNDDVLWSGKPVVFISCGQCTTKEQALGKTIADLVTEYTSATGYFAENQNTLDGVSRNILSAIDNAAGLIAVMHDRGSVRTPSGTHTRGSVWVEQEIAIASFLVQAQGRNIPAIVYLQEGIRREGLRDQLRLDVVQFRYSEEVIDDLARRLRKRIFVPTDTRRFRCHIDAVDVAIVRSSSFAELVGDISINIPHPPSDFSLVDINVSLGTNVTSRLVDSIHTAEVTLRSTRRGIIANGRIRVPNAISFESIDVSRRRIEFPENLMIKGIRADANFTGVENRPRVHAPIQARVEVVTADAGKRPRIVARAQFDVASVRRALTFFVEQSVKGQITSSTHTQVGPDCKVRLFIIRFDAAYRGVFMTRDQEGSNFGTTFAAAFQMIPKGFRVFVTAEDLHESGVPPLALCVVTASNGSHRGETRETTGPLWDGRIPMTEVDRNLLVAWEVVNPESRANIPSTQFGVAVVGPASAIPNVTPQVGGGLAPFYDPSPSVRQASATLPVPRFITTLTPTDLPLDWELH